MNYNSTFNRKLLQLYILLTDEKEITYDSFNEYDKPEPASFSRLINEYQNMIIKLKLNCTLNREEVKNQIDEAYRSSYIYYQTSLFEDYNYNLSLLSDQEKNRYIYVIIYLMLRNREYVSCKLIKDKLKIDVNIRTIQRIIRDIKNIVGFDIYKNELQSYVIDEEV